MRPGAAAAALVAAAAYRMGFCVIPPTEDGDKRPAIDNWAEYQDGESRPGVAQIEDWYIGPHACSGVGFLTGAASNNLVALDFDDGASAYAPLRELADASGLGPLFDRIESGYSESTGGAGRHLLYFSADPGRNTKLARRPKADHERKDPKDLWQVLIETRATGGYIIVAPTNGKVHPTGGAWTQISGGLDSIATITAEEQTALFALCRSLDQSGRERAPDGQPATKGQGSAGGELRPGDDFNQRATWAEVLEPHGWKRVFARAGVTYWRRPGKTTGISATTNHAGSDLLYVFSTSTAFDSERGYSKFSAYALLAHNGDFAATAKGLAANGYGSSTEAGGDASWPPLGQLPSETGSAPTLPPELVPAPLRPWLVEAAGLLCVPLEFVAVPALVALASVVGRRVTLAPLEKSDWTVCPNLWGAVVGPPGFLKSPAMAEALRPLNRLAATAREEYEANRDSTDAERDRIEAEIAVAKERFKQAAKRGEPADTTALAALKAALRESGRAERRYLTSDATVEKLGELLAENPHGMLIVRDELAGWLTTLEREGRQGEREFFLEGWSGTGRFDFDRIGRGTVHVDSLTLSIIGGIQPGKLNRWFEGAIEGGGEADGLVQRFGLIAYPDDLGPYVKPSHWPDSEARNRAFEVFRRLDTLDVSALQPEIDDRGLPFVRFDEPAQAAFDHWYGDNQARIRSGELAETPAFASYVAKQGKTVGALALLFELAVAFGTFGTALPRPFRVGVAAFYCAAALTELFEEHAKKLYAPELNPTASPARALARHIGAGRVRDGDTVRDLYRHHWAALSSQGAVDLAIGGLAAIGWVRTEAVTTGGRPSEILRVNPALVVTS